MKENEIQKIVENFGAKLYDTEIEKAGDGSIFRVLIMVEGGVTVEICEKISRVLSPFLDMNPPVRGPYYLEVSSPGIERRLTKPEHYTYSIGENIKLKLSDSEKPIGKLLEVTAHGISMEKKDGSILAIPFGSILKAKTYFEWKS